MPRPPKCSGTSKTSSTAISRARSKSLSRRRRTATAKWPRSPPGDYVQAAKEAFARMSPEERVQFGRYLGQEAQRQGHDFIDLNQDGIDDRLQDPDYLAQTTSRAHQEQPGLLGQLFGGSGSGGGHAGGGTGGGMLSSPLAKGVLGGIAAYGLSRML